MEKRRKQYMQNTNEVSTINYYNSNAKSYFSSTVNVDMSTCYERFVKYLKPGGCIIDVGAGSGRDIMYFLKCGFEVEGIDASVELCKLASDYTGVKVECNTIQEWKPEKRYNGIWANASLLHLDIEEIQKFMDRISDMLQDKGVLYFSLKSGIVTGTDSDGRFFTDVSEENIQHFIEKNTDVSIVNMWQTEDKLNREGICWINVILQKS